jgi:ABC-type molybdate transport system ATPase subunit
MRAASRRAFIHDDFVMRWVRRVRSDMRLPIVYVSDVPVQLVRMGKMSTSVPS